MRCAAGGRRAGARRPSGRTLLDALQQNAEALCQILETPTRERRMTMKALFGIVFGAALGAIGTSVATRSSSTVLGWVAPQARQRSPLPVAANGRQGLAVMAGEMLIVRRADAIALIELTDFGKFEARYRWRSRKFWSTDEQRGNGSLVQRFEAGPRADGRVYEDSARTNTRLTAGPFNLQWVYRSERSGFVFYSSGLDVTVSDATGFNAVSLMDLAKQ